MNYLVLIQNLDSASGVCVKRIASEFRRNGDQLWIITESPIDREDKYIITIGNNKRYKNKFARILHRIKTLLLYPIWPRQRLFLYHRLYNASKEFIITRKIDAIICVYNSVEALMVGHRIKTENPRILYIPYFLDALYGGQKPYFMSETCKKRKALRVERRLLDNADQIIMMTPSKYAYERDNIQPKYLEKTIFLDIPLFCPIPYALSHKRYFPKDTINLFYCGSMPNNIRNPKALVEIFTRINDDKYHLYIAGPTDYDKLLVEASSRCNRIHLLGIISYEEAQVRIKEADILVNIGNTLSYMVPSKIFEYISYGKRIISTYRIKDDPCITYLNKYQNSLLINETDDYHKSAQLIVKFFMSTCDYCNTNLEVFYNNTPKAFYDCIKRLSLN